MRTPPRFDSGQASLVGDRVTNQDRCVLVPWGRGILLGLADGMGGHPKGDVAAQILVDRCRRLSRGAPEPEADPQQLLCRLLYRAHEEIQRYGRSRNPPVEPRTTAVVALIQDDRVYWCHAGDSRLYLFRNGQLLTRTTDHSYVEMLWQQGIISRSEKAAHPYRNFVTRCLGGAGPAPELEPGQEVLLPGDVLLLCSDGLWGSIDEESMIDVLFRGRGMQEAAQTLAEEAARAAYPESDNVTLITFLLAAGPADEGDERVAGDGDDSELGQAIARLRRAIDDVEKDREKK